jgi:RNA polymerase sigma factor (sigma-70 family)
MTTKRNAQKQPTANKNNQSPSDKEQIEKCLIEKAQSGGKDANDAFNQLITTYRDHVAQYAQSVLGDYDAAQDAVQNTVIFAWANISRFTYKPNGFKHWLLAICKNKNYEVRRDRQYEDFIHYALKEEETQAQSVDPYTTPRLKGYRKEKDYLIQREPTESMLRSILPRQKINCDVELLKRAFINLPNLQRKVLWMRYNEYTISEISHELGITRNAVSQNLFKARQKVIKSLPNDIKI